MPPHILQPNTGNDLAKFEMKGSVDIRAWHCWSITSTRWNSRCKVILVRGAYCWGFKSRFPNVKCVYSVTHQVVPKLSIQGLCNNHTGPELRVWEQPELSPCSNLIKIVSLALWWWGRRLKRSAETAEWCRRKCAFECTFVPQTQSAELSRLQHL